MDYKDVVKNDRKMLAMTGYTQEEFEALLPYFKEEFETYMKTYTFEGEKRVKRTYSSYKNSPLPTIEDKLLFILVYLKLGHLQETQASLFNIHQPDANKWIHLLHPILNKTLSKTGETPARQAEELKQNLSQSRAEMEAANVEDKIFFKMGQKGRLYAQQTMNSKNCTIVANKDFIVSRTSLLSIPSVKSSF